MQADVDTAPCRAACEKMTEKGGVLPPCGIRDMLAAVEKCSLCIGMRLHSLIYAVSRGVPAIGLVYDPKISGVMDYMGKKERFDVRTVTKEELCRAAEHLLSEKDGDDGQQLAALRKKAEENAVLAAELLAENRKNGGKKA